jgi:hypothetical protein
MAEAFSRKLLQEWVLTGQEIIELYEPLKAYMTDKPKCLFALMKLPATKVLMYFIPGDRLVEDQIELSVLSDALYLKCRDQATLQVPLSAFRKAHPEYEQLLNETIPVRVPY